MGTCYVGITVGLMVRVRKAAYNVHHRIQTPFELELRNESRSRTVLERNYLVSNIPGHAGHGCK
jgi:hypothetical protein